MPEELARRLRVLAAQQNKSRSLFVSETLQKAILQASGTAKENKQQVTNG
jgi:hypothetical protein